MNSENRTTGLLYGWVNFQISTHLCFAAFLLYFNCKPSFHVFPFQLWKGCHRFLISYESSKQMLMYKWRKRLQIINNQKRIIISVPFGIVSKLTEQKLGTHARKLVILCPPGSLQQLPKREHLIFSSLSLKLLIYGCLMMSFYAVSALLPKL